MWDVSEVNSEKGKKIGSFIIVSGLRSRLGLNIGAGISEYYFCTTLKVKVYTFWKVEK